MTTLQREARPGMNLGLWVQEHKHSVSIMSPLNPLRLTTPEQRAVYWKMNDRKRTAWDISVKKMVAARFKDEEKAVQSVLPDVSAVEQTVKEQKPKWERLYTAVYLSVGRDFAVPIWDSLKSMPGYVETKAPSMESTWSKTVTDYVKTEGGSRISSVEGTTLDSLLPALRDIIDSGIAEGDRLQEMSDAVEKLYAGWEDYRAERIARTEVHTASNLGAQAAAESTGLDLKKTWISIQDDRTRGQGEKDEFDHIDMDGVESPLDEPYTVSGEDMAFPGDSELGASAGNVINCRCSEGYDQAATETPAAEAPTEEPPDIGGAEALSPQEISDWISRVVSSREPGIASRLSYLADEPGYREKVFTKEATDAISEVTSRGLRGSDGHYARTSKTIVIKSVDDLPDVSQWASTFAHETQHAVQSGTGQFTPYWFLNLPRPEAAALYNLYRDGVERVAQSMVQSTTDKRSLKYRLGQKLLDRLKDPSFGKQGNWAGVPNWKDYNPYVSLANNGARRGYSLADPAEWAATMFQNYVEDEAKLKAQAPESWAYFDRYFSTGSFAESGS